MAISGIGYLEDNYNNYYHADAGKVIAKDKDSEAADCLTGGGDAGRTADSGNRGRSAKALTGMQGRDGNGWGEYGTAAWQRGTMRGLLHDKFGMTDGQIEEEVGKYPSAVPERGKGAPYSYLANEDGVVEYNGVVFTINNEKRWLCLGDMSNMDNVIRIPMSQGGCLMVNRDCIGALGRAIGMFSPEDVNNILRALKMDAKIQEMKKEIEEMEDGIGKGNEEEYADSMEDAREAAEENGNDGGFNGYGEDGKTDGVFQLEEWRLELLLGKEEDEGGGLGAWYEPVLGQWAEQREERDNGRDY